MDFESLQPAIVAWLKTLTGLDVVIWENDPRPLAPGLVALLAWLDEPVVGVDEQRVEDSGAPAPTPDLTPVVVGVRTLTLQVGLETFRQDPAAPHARALASRLRARLHLPSSHAALAAANLGLIGAGPAVRADYRGDGGRWVARVVVELRFNATTCEVDAALPSLAAAEVTSTFVTPTGAAETADLQLAGDAIP
jgi:hypothetical protein